MLVRAEQNGCGMTEQHYAELRVISADGLKRGGSDIRDALLLDENGALYNSSGLRQAIDGAMSHIARANESDG